jgi:hypothetical protein
MKRAAVYLVLTPFLASALLLAACGSDGGEQPSPSGPSGEVVTFDVNGRTVPCIVIDPSGAALAMSCDWTGEATR